MTDEQPITLDDILKMDDGGKAQKKTNTVKTDKVNNGKKNFPNNIKVSENENERILERVCADCRHIFHTNIPVKYFYTENKKGDHFELAKLPPDQYPADLPQDIAELIETDKCPKCRNK